MKRTFIAILFTIFIPLHYMSQTIETSESNGNVAIYTGEVERENRMVKVYQCSTPEGSIVARNPQEFLCSIGSHMSIQLLAIDYILDDVIVENNPHLKYGDLSASPEILNVENLKIKGQGNKSRLLVRSRRSETLEFYSSKNIEISHLQSGHLEQSREDYCDAGVIKFMDSEGIHIHHVDLFGSGIFGVMIYTSKKLHFHDSVIHDCTWGAIEVAYLQDALFERIEIRNNIASDSLIGVRNSSNLRFHDLVVHGNKGSRKYEATYGGIMFGGFDNHEVTLDGLNAYNNTVDYFEYQKGQIRVIRGDTSSFRFPSQTDEEED